MEERAPRRRDPGGRRGRRSPSRALRRRSHRGAILDAGLELLAETDAPTARHSDDVVRLAEAVARRLGLADEDRERLVAAAAMHDIGKVVVGREIIARPGPLDDHEWEIVRRHTVEGERMVRAMPGMADVAPLVRHAHERFDGAGYPDGLAGEQIPLLSRIVFCADAFDAIRSDRPYRAGRSTEAALAEIRAGAGTQFDPRVVDALHAAVRDLGPPGTRRRHRRPSPQVALAAALCAIAGGAWAMAISGGEDAGEDRRARLPDRAPVAVAPTPERPAAPRGGVRPRDPGAPARPPAARPAAPAAPPAREQPGAGPRAPSAASRAEGPTADPAPARRASAGLRVRSAPDAAVETVAPAPAPASADGFDALPALPEDPAEALRLLARVRLADELRRALPADPVERVRALVLLVLARR